LPRPKKATLKHDAIPTIFDYEDRTSKPASDKILSRKRKHEESSSQVHWKGRKKLEVIDFNSLLDDYLNGLQSEEELHSANSAPIKIESDELVGEIIPGSSPCEGGDKFVLLLNKLLPADIDIQSSLFCVRFGSGNVVPASLWKEQAVIGEYIPRSEKPGVVVVQLETTDGKVLGSTKFIYKEEISTGFRKLVCSKNYGGRFLKALTNVATKKDPVLNSQTSQETVSLPPLSVELTSILRLMLYIAAKQEASGFVEDLFRTKAGKAVINSFTDEEKNKEHVPQSTLQQGLTSYLAKISNRLTAEEKEKEAVAAAKLVKVEVKKQPKPVKKPVLKKKEVKTKPKKPGKGKLTCGKKPANGNTRAIGTDCSDVSTSKTNSLLMLSSIALGDLTFHSNENSVTVDVSLNTAKSSLLSVKKERESSYQSLNARRKLLLLPSGSTRLPPQSDLLKLKTSSAVNRGTLHLENDMTAADVLKEVRTVLSMLGKKRIRLAAADSSGKLEFFKGTKWTAKTLRQRIRSNSVLYVVPSS